MLMNCRIVEMRNKEVISIKDATRLGCVSDLEIDMCSGKIVSIIIYGRPRCLGLFGREDDIVIDWCSIEVIGDDTVLVSCDPPRKKRKKGLFSGLSLG